MRVVVHSAGFFHHDDGWRECDHADLLSRSNPVFMGWIRLALGIGGAPTVGRAQSHSTMASSSSASASAAGQELEEFLKVLDKEPSTVSALAGTFSPTCAHPHP